jgi:hypothetical protein
MRPQFCSDKIAWFVTRHSAERCARLYHQPAAAAQGIAAEILLAQAKRLKRKARFFAVWEFAAQIPKPQKMRPNSDIEAKL